MRETGSTVDPASGADRVYRDDIDGLRAIAVVLVILFHLDVPGFSGGFLGVDVFFVISGYLITDRIRVQRERGTFSLRRFYLRRIRRLVPALTATIAGALLGGALLFDTGLLVSTAESAIYASFSVANFHFWRTSGYFDVHSSVRPLLHTWSLGIEEQFYLVWPGLLIALLGFRRRLPLLAIAIVSSFLVDELLITSAPSAAFYLLPGRFFELAIGAFLALLPTTRPASVSVASPMLEELGLGAGLALLIALSAIYDEHTRFPGTAALVVCLATALVIVTGRARFVGTLLRNRLAVWVGRVSYSAYLVHWPLIVFVEYALFRPRSPIETGLAFGGTFVLAAILHRAVEVRFRHAPEKSARRFLVAQAALVLVVAGIAADGVLSEGWPRRLDAVAREHAAARTRTGYPPCAPTDVVCRFGSTANEVDIVVIGDSHAKHLVHGLDTYAKARQLSVLSLTDRACAPLPEVYTALRGVVQTRCTTSRKRIFETLDSVRPRLVLLSFGYLGYQRAFSTVDGTPLDFDTPADFAKYFEGRIEAGIERFAADDRVFAIVLPTLRPGFDPVECLGRPRLVDRRGWRGRCPLEPANKLFAPSRPIERALVELAARRVDTQVLDPNVALCPEQTCRLTDDDGHLLFSDYHHLSAAGSDAVFGALAPRLDALLGIRDAVPVAPGVDGP